jgi:hypothetical protein
MSFLTRTPLILRHTNKLEEENTLLKQQIKEMEDAISHMDLSGARSGKIVGFVCTFSVAF